MLNYAKNVCFGNFRILRNNNVECFHSSISLSDEFLGKIIILNETELIKPNNYNETFTVSVLERRDLWFFV